LGQRVSICWDKPLSPEILGTTYSSSVDCIKVIGDKLICGCYDGDLDVWCLKTNKFFRKIKTEHEPVSCIEGVGNTIVTGGGMVSNICQWDLNTGFTSGRFVGHLQNVRSMKLVGDLLVSASNDHTVKTWCFPSKTCLYTLEGHEGDVTSVDFDGKLIVSGSADLTVRLWDHETRTCLRIITGHVDTVTTVSFFKDNQLITGSTDGTLRLWNLLDGDCKNTFHMGFAAYVWSTCTTGDYVICGCDENIKVWDVSKGVLVNTLMGHQDHVWGLQVVDDHFISCSEDCTVRLWKQLKLGGKKKKKGKKYQPEEDFSDDDDESDSDDSWRAESSSLKMNDASNDTEKESKDGSRSNKERIVQRNKDSNVDDECYSEEFLKF